MHREWVENTNDHTIEEFSIKFMHAHPQTAYDDFTSAITNSKLKEHVKRAVLENMKTWKESKSRAALFWLGQKQALAIKQGKSVVGTSLVEAAANELPNIIHSKANYVSWQKINERTVFSVTSLLTFSELLSLYFACVIRTTCLIRSQRKIPRRAHLHGSCHQGRPESEPLLELYWLQTRKGVELLRPGTSMSASRRVWTAMRPSMRLLWTC